MMFLKRLYSEPPGLFKHTINNDGVIEFKNGINFIFGKKDSENDATESLNGIGKSLLLDLLDFCLLSSFDKKRNSRLYETKEYLTGYNIVLEFELEGVNYMIRRTVDDPSKAEFGELNQVTTFETIKDLGRVLCDLIFKVPGYPGYYENNLLRKLLPFFIKIHRPKEGRFTDPVEYLKGCYPTELNQYHLFFLGIDNSLAHDNFLIQTSLKEKEPALAEIGKVVKDKYGLTKIADIDTEIDNLNREIKRLDQVLETFKLAPQYQDVEKKINELTEEIKKNIYLNFQESKKIKQYRESYRQKDGITNLRQIENIYKDLNTLLAGNIKKELSEAVAFKEKLARSREEFLADEIEELEENIKVRTEIIRIKENERARLFEFLEVKDAIKDLTEALYILNEKKKRKAELEGNINLYKDISKEKAKLVTRESQLQEEILDYLETIKEPITQFREIFVNIYNHTYPDLKDRLIFNISHDFETQQKISIEVRMPAMRSEGKNQGRTLIYDLAVLLHAVDKNLRRPGFLVHDGIFDSMDKAHFVAIVNLLNSMSRSGKKFQYILPINEEGTLNEKFGKVEQVTPEKIEEEAIIVLTPTKKLLGTSWS